MTTEPTLEVALERIKKLEAFLSGQERPGMYRKCRVFKETWPNGRNNKPEREYLYDAIYHGLSMDYEDVGSGLGIYPVAIVELQDGSFAAPSINFVQLDEPTVL